MAEQRYGRIIVTGTAQMKSLPICIAPAARGLSRNSEAPSDSALVRVARMQSVFAITTDGTAL